MNPRESGKNQPKDVARLVCKKMNTNHQSTFSLPFEIFLNEELSDIFWKPLVPSTRCPKSFRAVSKKGKFYMKYEHIVKCLLTSDWIPAKTEDMGGICAGRERAILLSTALVEFRKNNRHRWQMKLSDTFRFDRIGFPYIPYSLTLRVLRILLNRVKDKAITNFASLAREVLAAHDFVYIPLLVIRRTIIYNHETARSLIVSFMF